MAFTTKRVPDLTEVTGAADEDNLMINPTGGNAIRRITAGNLIKKILGALPSTLQTTAKTVIGAINELNTNMFMFRGTLTTTIDAVLPSGIYTLNGTSTIGTLPTAGNHAVYGMIISVIRSGISIQVIIDANYVYTRQCSPTTGVSAWVAH